MANGPDNALKDALDRYQGQLRREKSLSEAASSPVDSLLDQAKQARAKALTDGLKNLFPEDTLEIVDVLGEALDTLGGAFVGVADPYQGESDFISGLMRVGGEGSVRGLAMAAYRQIQDSCLAIAGVVLQDAQTLKDDVTKLQSSFALFDRTSFSSAADLGGSTVTQAAAIQVRLAAALKQGKAVGSFSILGAELDSICAEMTTWFEFVLLPGSTMSLIYALIGRIETRIQSIIDRLIEFLDTLQISLKAKTNVSGPGPFSVQFRLLSQAEGDLSGFLGAVTGLKVKPAFLRADVLRRLVLKLQTIHGAFCATRPRYKVAVDASVGGSLLAGLEVSFTPLVSQVESLLTDFREGAIEWLLAFRNHVQVDRTTEFNGVVTDLLASADVLINVATAIKTAVAGPSFPIPASVDAYASVSASGLGGAALSINQGNVSAIEQASVASATAAGSLADALSAERVRLAGVGQLTSALAATADSLITFLRNRHRASMQAAAIRASISSQAIRSRDQKRGVAEGVAQKIQNVFLPAGS